jgi:hypothetical protein
MRTTVDLDPGLLRRLRAEAHRRAVPLKQLLNQVIRRGLDAPGESAPYECPTFSMGQPSSSVNLDKALRLSGALEDEETAREIELRK